MKDETKIFWIYGIALPFVAVTSYLSQAIMMAYFVILSITAIVMNIIDW